MARRELDFYETPAWMTRGLLANQRIAGAVFEPCCGDGSIVNTLREAGLTTIITNDINPERAADFHLDAAHYRTWDEACVSREVSGIDWVITNPPFEQPLCLNILRHAFDYARVGVAFMLRLSFKEPTKTKHPRGPWLQEHPISRELVMPRHSFTGDGKSDSMTTAWMIWIKDHSQYQWPPMLSLYDAKERYAESTVQALEELTQLIREAA